MAKIKIKDLPKDLKVSEDQLKKIKGGLLFRQSSIGGLNIRASGGGLLASGGALFASGGRLRASGGRLLGNIGGLFIK